MWYPLVLLGGVVVGGFSSKGFWIWFERVFGFGSLVLLACVFDPF